MDIGFKLSAKGWVAVFSVFAFYIIAAVCSGDVLNIVFYGIIAISTAGVAAFDSMHVHLRRYKTAISYGPIGLFVLCALFWPVIIVWYFMVRVRIARGTMPVRSESEQKPLQSSLFL